MANRKDRRIVVLAGPNGAGKTTSAARILKGPFNVAQFVNADTIAAGLSAFAPEKAAFQSGRVMLKRLKDLASARASFAFETTPATRSYARWLRSLGNDRYWVDLVFLWLPSAEMAIERVAHRVQAGGHHIPEAVIRRRYDAGIANLRELYLPVVDAWRVINNTDASRPTIIASGMRGDEPQVFDHQAWRSIIKT